jgi:hypothetical protein
VTGQSNEHPAPKPEARQRTEVVSVRLSPAELAAVQQKATELGRTVSACLRDLAVGDLTQAGRAQQPLTIIIHREGDRWWAEIIGHPEYVAGDSTFDGLCERLAEGLHLLGLTRERTVITTGDFPGMGVTASTHGQRTLVIRERAS